MSETLINVILVIHAAAATFMAGLIWFVQIVHYPLFANVGAGGFATYELLHQRRTTLVVGPAMLIEACMASMIPLLDLKPLSISLAWLGLSLLAFIWLSTAFLQVPCHRRLEAGFDVRTARRLVNSNWIRTVLWSARSVLAFLLLGSS